MWQELKLWKWNLQDRYRRLLTYNFFIRELPDTFGERIRGKIFAKYFASCGSNLVISVGFRFSGIKNLTIGDNVRIGVDNFIQASGGIILGDDVLLGPGVKIWSINHRFGRIDIPIIEQGYDSKGVTIGNGVWIGANVFIMPGVDIPAGCVVAAGSVVGIKRYPPFSIIAGNPARVVGQRK